MVQKRAHIFVPEAILAEIDKLVGKGKRSILITEILDHEIRRRRLMQILGGEGHILSGENLEWKDGAYGWVRQMRDDDDKRTRKKLGDWLLPRE